MTLRPRQVLEGPEPTAPRPLRRRPIPYVAGAVLAISVLFFLVDGGGTNARFMSPAPGTGGRLLQVGALFGPAVVAGQWWRVLLTVFEHGGPLHIFFNMWVLVTLGFALERIIGSGRMAVISLVTALGASGFALFFNFNIPTIGASGMILGWAGAMVPLLTAEGRRSIWIWVIEVAVISILPGLRISWAGHLGGFVLGLLCGVTLRANPRRFYAYAPGLLALGLLVVIFAVHAHAGHPPSSYRL